VQRRVEEGLLEKACTLTTYLETGPYLEDRILALAHTVVKGKGQGGPSPDPTRLGSLHLCCGLQELRYIRINGVHIRTVH
jgi:hypothetical protein